MRMHEVPTLIAFLGGVAVFGVSGMVLGPVILAVTLAVLDVWKMRIRGDTPAAPA
jgi:predicted PurR-regulated permease PerM